MPKKEKRGTNSERLLRVLELLKQTDIAHPMTENDLVEKLDRVYGIDAEKKAVGRDIAVLNHCGYFIELCADNKRGWYYDRDFEDWELKVLMDAVQSAKFLDQPSTDRIAEKIRNLASGEIKKALQLMTIPADAKTGDSSTKQAIDNVMRAIRWKGKMVFDYHDPEKEAGNGPTRPGQTDLVSPYALIWRQDRYYLIASHDGKTLSYYPVNRMYNSRVLREPAVPLRNILGGDEEKKLRAFVRKNIYAKKGREVRLELQVTPRGAGIVKETFGDDTHFMKNRDGTLHAWVTVSDSEGLYSWLMQYGKELTVRKPEAVRKEMQRRLKEIMDHYSGEEEHTDGESEKNKRKKEHSAENEKNGVDAKTDAGLGSSEIPADRA